MVEVVSCNRYVGREAQRGGNVAGGGQGKVFVWFDFVLTLSEFTPGLPCTPSLTNTLFTPKSIMWAHQICPPPHTHTYMCNLECVLYVCVFACVFLISICLRKWPGINDTLVALSMPGP